MMQPITSENTATAGGRPFADPTRFGALVARIDSEIEALARDRRKLAAVRRNVFLISSIYVVVGFCVQNAVRAGLAHPGRSAETSLTVPPVRTIRSARDVEARGDSPAAHTLRSRASIGSRRTF